MPVRNQPSGLAVPFPLLILKGVKPFENEDGKHQQDKLWEGNRERNVANKEAPLWL